MKVKNTADKDSRYKNLALFKAKPVYEGKLKVLSHDFEPTYIYYIGSDL